MNQLSENSIRERLRRFLEVHNKSKILDAEKGTLKMHVLLSKSKNSKPKEKLINFLLLRIMERLIEGPELDDKNTIICDFLMEELEKFVAKSL